ncbi:hypothetical protein PHJA_001169600 [Phtheirospermum japonicum]|uniref:Retrotransposon gag domain-containing protein n=1 Tax=Phtheirospermum japonicum TaxID=374723 RepID=A0A830BR68_9LAMI|nr:hypothetical protein PHJA_001169600 [Phtheirospermum japonicum]
MLWKRCNAMIRGWLNSAMDKEIRSSVKYAKTAKEIWDDLEERFGKACAPRAYELKRTLTHTRQKNTTVSAYYTKLRSIWDEMKSLSTIPKCKCGKCSCELSKEFQEIRNKEQLYEFLMGLDESFGTVKTQILSTRPTPSLSVAYHMCWGCSPTGTRCSVATEASFRFVYCRGARTATSFSNLLIF